MRKLSLFRITLVIVAILFASCAPKGASGDPTASSTALVYATPDKGMATPVYGFAQRPRSQGIQPLLLYSQPSADSAVSGQIYPGDEGSVLGMDASEAWVLVQFGETVGWTPVMTLALTIAQ
jgi:hypothetical protein